MDGDAMVLDHAQRLDKFVAGRFHRSANVTTCQLSKSPWNRQCIYK